MYRLESSLWIANSGFSYTETVETGIKSVPSEKQMKSIWEEFCGKKYDEDASEIICLAIVEEETDKVITSYPFWH